MSPIVYTPLENLVLFQTLISCKEIPSSFDKVSDTLKQDELLLDSEDFDLTRLDPESLQSQYLRIIKEEVKEEHARSASPVKDGLSPRKRKRSTPPLETVDEARHYAHLLPQILTRLQLDFQEYAIQALREEEKQYHRLQKEIQEIEQNEKDERTQAKAVPARRDSRGRTSIDTILRHDEDDGKLLAKSQLSPNAAQHFEEKVELQPGMPKQPANGAENLQSSTGTRLGPIEEQRPPPAISADIGVPYRPPPQPVSRAYPLESPTSDNHRMLPPPSQLQSQAGPLPAPRPLQHTLPSVDRSSASPIILPPPKGMLRSSGSPTGPLDAIADIPNRQNSRGSPTVQSPRFMQQQGSQQHPHQPPQPRNYNQPPYPYYEHQPRYPAPYPAYGQSPLPPANYPHHGAMPPYQGPIATPGQGSPYNNVPQFQSPLSPYPPPGYNQASGYYQHPANTAPYPRGQIPRFSDQHTPQSNISSRHRSFKPSPIHTSASSTRWKNVDTPGSVRQSSPIRPTERDISPISDKAPSPLPSPKTLPTPTNDTNVESQMPTSGSRGGSVRGRGGRGRGTKRGRGGRVMSSASTTRADQRQTRTRSQSITSQADELSIDQSTSTRKIKPEPSRASVHEDDNSVASITADESNRKSRRQPREPVRSPDEREDSHSMSKTPTEEPSILPPSSPVIAQFSKPGFILGTRNFPRISATLMNDIITHKVASLFAKPLTEREAPGYKDLIYRPQDLKSIKNAIGAGGRALAAAAEISEESKDAMNVWVPATPDVVPPKGIINSAQLEKELMRMFANAIMFNPDIPAQRGLGPAFRTRQRVAQKRDMDDATDQEDDDEAEEVVKGKQDVSVVKDTREMFEAVQKSVGEWSGAERAVILRGGGSEEREDDEADELAGTGEDVMGSVEEQEITPEPRNRKRRR